MTELWPSLLLSLRIATAATVLAALVAVPLAHLLARRIFPGKSVVETVLVVPLVSPANGGRLSPDRGLWHSEPDRPMAGSEFGFRFLFK